MYGILFYQYSVLVFSSYPIKKIPNEQVNIVVKILATAKMQRISEGDSSLKYYLHIIHYRILFILLEIIYLPYRIVSQRIVFYVQILLTLEWFLGL